MGERREFDVAVVGLGGIGSGAAYWAAKRAGAGVLGLERFELGHERGASQDHSRIIRLSYHTPGYVRFAQDAYAAWADVEDASGEQLVVTTGGIDLYPPDAMDWAPHYERSLDAARAAVRVDGCRRGDAPLAAVAAGRRHPRDVPGVVGDRRCGTGPTRRTDGSRPSSARRSWTTRA